MSSYRVALVGAVLLVVVLVAGPVLAQVEASESVALVVHVPFFEDVAWAPVWSRLLLVLGLALGLWASRFLLSLA